MAATSVTTKLIIVAYAIVVHVLAIMFVVEKISESRKPVPPVPAPVMTDTVLRRDTAAATTTPYTVPEADPGKLIIPVAGILRKDLQDTYTQSRSGNRTHNAIDIMAPGGTPVLAAADGIIARFFDSKLGGTTIYQWNIDSSHIYYYAHLQRRADGISEGMRVRRGTIIGYVGDTGDAGPGNFHLHFGISTPTAPGRYWSGNDINPYPILKEGIEAPAARE